MHRLYFFRGKKLTTPIDLIKKQPLQLRQHKLGRYHGVQKDSFNSQNRTDSNLEVSPKKPPFEEPPFRFFSHSGTKSLIVADEQVWKIRHAHFLNETLVKFLMNPNKVHLCPTGSKETKRTPAVHRFPTQDAFKCIPFCKLFSGASS